MIKHIFYIFFILLSHVAMGQLEFGAPDLVLSHTAHLNQIEHGDMDQDGDQDLVVICSQLNGSLAWFENDGNGEFRIRHEISNISAHFYSLDVEDVDQDGDDDVIVGDWWNPGDAIYFFENLGGGEFAEPTIVGTDNYLVSTVKAVDLDGDGDADVIASNREGDTYVHYENLGDGLFSPADTIEVDADTPWFVGAADLDNDGAVDIVGNHRGGIYWYQNDGEGNFSDSITIYGEYIGTNGAEIRLGIVDLDQDGDTDIVGNVGVHPLSWFENQGDGTFEAPQEITTAEEAIENEWIKPRYFSFADIDGDLDLEILCSFQNQFPSQLVWFENDGQENFEGHLIDDIANYPARTLLLDLDMDNDLDIYAHTNNQSVAEYENLGDGVFSEYEPISENPLSIYSSELLDADEDGDNDLLITQHDNPTSRLVYFENTGDTEFKLPLTLLKSDSLFYSIVGVEDFDSDDDLDFMIQEYSGYYSRVFRVRNNGGNQFEVLPAIPGVFESVLKLSDLNGDGLNDLVGVARDAGVDDEVIVYYNVDGNEYESPETISGGHIYINYMEDPDIDADGDTDLIFRSLNDEDLYWIENLGDTALAAEQVLISSSTLGGIEFGLIDNDSLPDIFHVYNSNIDPQLFWNRNNGDGTFTPNYIDLNNEDFEHAKLGDLDGDGDADIVVKGGESVWECSYRENLGDGVFDDKVIVTPYFTGTVSHLIDLDLDSDLDIISLSGGLMWMENLAALGCTDPAACNFDPDAQIDNNTCCFGVCGCTNPDSPNYNVDAECDDNSCIILGCTNSEACNYDAEADQDDGSCVLPDGCQDPEACNFDPNATCDDGSCYFDPCYDLGDFNGDGVIDVSDLLDMLGNWGCTEDCANDINGDGVVNVNDLLIILQWMNTTYP